MTYQQLVLTEKLQFAEITRELYGRPKAFINNEPATDEDLAELECRLRAGLERATGEIRNGFVYYKTI